MAITRPSFNVNLANNKKATERKTVFYDLKPDTRTLIRVAPPVTDNGLIFTKVTNHFRLKNDEGFGLALACLEDHGNEEIGEDCYLCNVVKYLKSTGDKQDAKLADDLRASPRWYMQGWIYDSTEEAFFGPKLIGLSKTTAEALHEILVDQEESGDDFFCDPDKGQAITIKRKGSGLATRYTVTVSGQKMALDDIVPNWETKIMTDVYTQLEQKVEDVDGQARALLRTYPDELDWEALQANV